MTEGWSETKRPVPRRLAKRPAGANIATLSARGRRRAGRDRGRSSGVERNLAKVDVEGSNPFARSKTFSDQQKGRAFTPALLRCDAPMPDPRIMIPERQRPR